jgi:hypothetical protein
LGAVVADGARLLPSATALRRSNPAATMAQTMRAQDTSRRRPETRYARRVRSIHERLRELAR